MGLLAISLLSPPSPLPFPFLFFAFVFLYCFMFFFSFSFCDVSKIFPWKLFKISPNLLIYTLMVDLQDKCLNRYWNGGILVNDYWRSHRLFSFQEATFTASNSFKKRQEKLEMLQEKIDIRSQFYLDCWRSILSFKNIKNCSFMPIIIYYL